MQKTIRVIDGLQKEVVIKEHAEEINRLFKAKISFHNELAKMSFEEKIKILVRLQKMANDIQVFSTKQRKRRQKIWEI